MNEHINDHTIALLRESFDLIEPIAPQAGTMFYANLFEADPSLRPLFAGDSAGDMSEQGAALMQMIALAVARLDEPELLVPALQALGRHHAAHGLRAEHCDATRVALLKTLYQCLGAAYNAEVEAAWVEAHALAADTLKEVAGMPA